MLSVLTRFVPRLLVLAVLPLVLAGCFRVDISIHVEEDGSGTVAMLLAVDESMLTFLQSQGGSDSSPLDLLTDLDTATLPPGVTVEPYSEDGFSGARITIPFAAGDDVAATLDAAFAAMGGADAADGPVPLEDFVLRRESDDGWRFEATVSSPTGGETGGVDASAARFLLGNASFAVRVLLPGEVVETNADEQTADGELIWNIDPLGDRRTLSALTRPAGGGGPNALLLDGLALVTILAVGGIGLYVRRGATKPPAGVDGPSSEGTPSG